MKRFTKLAITIGSLFFGGLVLTGCTVPFCSNCDNAHMLAAYDDGITVFSDTQKEGFVELKEEFPDSKFEKPLYVGFSLEYNCGGLKEIYTKAAGEKYIATPHIDYWKTMDYVLLNHIVDEHSEGDFTYKKATADIINSKMKEYGYMKFDADKDLEKPALWDNWNLYDREARAIVKNIDKCPTTDFESFYKTSMNTFINTYRSCITTKTGDYGNYGYAEKAPIVIEGKTYQEAWGKGFLEGLLVYPIGALVDVLVGGLSPLGTGLPGSNTNGWAQLLAIVIVTIIVRTIMFFASFKQSMDNAKMAELQPEISKIQAKYPNANNSQNEKARMSQEMNALYKKNKINPFGSIIVMILQFPVFICVWGALSGSAWLSTGSFCNLNLSDSISSALFNASNWNIAAGGPALTALILFILMAGAQVVSMLLPQWIQKKKQKNVAKLGKNPTQNSQNKTTKWVTYIMMIMIIVMGFSLASAMGVYWLIGALFSIAQTLITQKITGKKHKEKKYR